MNISNCCYHEAVVETADEGTKCYVCNKCGEACDLVNPEGEL